MATVAIANGASIILPGLLGGVLSILQAAYDLYGQVNFRKTQLRVLLDRCDKLITEVKSTLPSTGINVHAKTKTAIAKLELSVF